MIIKDNKFCLENDIDNYIWGKYDASSLDNRFRLENVSFWLLNSYFSIHFESFDG